MLFAASGVRIEGSTSGLHKRQFVLLDTRNGAARWDVFHGCFPVRWEQRGGFYQPTTLKDFLIVECDYFEAGKNWAWVKAPR